MNPHYAASEDHRHLTHNPRVELLELARSQPSRCRVTLMAPISLSMKVWFDLKDDQMRPPRPRAADSRRIQDLGACYSPWLLLLLGVLAKKDCFLW